MSFRNQYIEICIFYESRCHKYFSIPFQNIFYEYYKYHIAEAEISQTKLISLIGNHERKSPEHTW